MSSSVRVKHDGLGCIGYANTKNSSLLLSCSLPPNQTLFPACEVTARLSVSKVIRSQAFSSSKVGGLLLLLLPPTTHHTSLLPPYLTLHFNLHIVQQSTLNAAGNLGDPEFGLVQQEQLAFSAKAKVCHSTAHLDLANELSTSIPDVDAIAASRIDVALQIALDAIGNAYITAVSGPTRHVASVHTTTTTHLHPPWQILFCWPQSASHASQSHQTHNWESMSSRSMDAREWPRGTHMCEDRVRSVVPSP